jgi:CRP/FNR family transcriptional regulator, cyclic AMP receptor protein
VDYEVLEGLSAPQRQSVLRQCVPEAFQRGDILVHEGAPGDALYLIESGRVALRITTPAGEVTTLSVLGAGQAFGEMALVGRRPRTATAVALEPVRTLLMSRERFEGLRRESPDVDRLLVDILASRVDRLSRQLAEVMYLSAETRLARRLLTLASVYRDGSEPVVVPLTQDDLAGLVGATRPTTNQLLRQLAADGAVTLSRGRVTVLDEPALRRVAAGPRG